MLSRTLLALTVCLAAACRDQPDALSGAPAPAATASLAVRVDLGRPLSPAAPQEPHKQAAPIYDGSEKTVMLDPSGCAPVVFEFTPPQGFDFDAKSNAAKWSRAHGPRTPLAIQTEKAWLDFIELDGYCADRRDAAQWRATHAKKIHIDDQPEHLFEASADPTVRAFRQRFEILAADLVGSSPVLEHRRTLPDGAPAGYVYDKYEGRCWHDDPDTRVVIQLTVDMPLKRETEGRKLLKALCAALATATFRRP